MAERDKIIKSGQFTWPRMLFLAAVGLFVFLMVSAEGGKYLSIGYWILTLAICGLLVMVAIDYGVKMEKVELQPGQLHPTLSSSTAVSSVESVDRPRPAQVAAAKPKRKGSRPAKRRR
jgi:hypothetical protein